MSQRQKHLKKMLKINNEFKLPKEVFGQEINLKLLAHVNHVYTERSHSGLRSTKTRSEINRTTKKVYKQKGTGGARHGSRRANLFVGGGVIFGPRPVRRILTLSQKVKMAAKIAAFSAKSKSKEISVVSGLPGVIKTGEVSKFLKGLTAKRFTFFLSEKSQSASRFLKNLSNVSTVYYNEASALDILNGGMLLIDEGALIINKEKLISNNEKIVKTKTAKTKKL